MKHRTLDINGDWSFGKGFQDLKTGDDAILLNLKTRINSWKGDCFFAVDEGIDWITFLGSKGLKDKLDEDLKITTIKSDGIAELVSFSSVLQNRNYSCKISVKTINSQTYKLELEQVF